VQRTAAIECKVKLIDPKGLPQTSSGKLSRSRAKTNYTSGVYGPPVPDQPGPSSRAPAPTAPAG
jgi:fatty-acyl-CoA synthase